MISRRAALGTGAGVVALAGAAVYGKQAGKLDDLARRAGVDPKRLPADSDKILIAAVREDQTALLVQARSAAAVHTGLAKALAPVIAIAEAQLGQLGGEVRRTATAPPSSAEAAITAIIQTHKDVADRRGRDAVEAVSGELAQVLASISVSVSQNVVTLRVARKDLT